MIIIQNIITCTYEVEFDVQMKFEFGFDLFLVIIIVYFTFPLIEFKKNKYIFNIVKFMLAIYYVQILIY